MTTSNWIRVAAKLPPPYVTVLVYIPGQTYITPTISWSWSGSVRMAYCDAEGRDWQDGMGNLLRTPSHWQPIPDAPEPTP